MKHFRTPPALRRKIIGRSAAALLAVALLGLVGCGSPALEDERIGADGTMELSGEQAASAITAEGNVLERSGGLGSEKSGRTAGSFAARTTAPPTTKGSAAKSQPKSRPSDPTPAPTGPAVSSPPPFEGFRLDVTSELIGAIRRVRVQACNDHSLARRQRVNWQNPAQGLYIVDAASGSPAVQYVNTQWSAVEGSLSLAPGECRELVVVDWDQGKALGCFDPIADDCLGAAPVGPGEYKVKFVWPARETDANGNEVMYPGVGGVHSVPFTI